MKQEPNNEMDLLLRRLGRRPDDAASNGDGRVEHLDADELSAYAENALPAAARTRYTEHLAECARCRELIVSLSGSAGVVVAQETTKAVAPSGFQKFLASLFSPMVLRYAAPALGLLVIAVIGVIVLRRPEDGHTDFIVQVPRNEAPAPSPASEPQQQSPSRIVNSVERDATANKQDAQSKTGEQQAPVPNAPPVVSSIETRVRQDSAATGAAAQPPPKESPVVAKTETADETKSKNESGPRKDVEVTAGRGSIANEPSAAADKTAAPTTTERRAEELPVQKRGIAGLADVQAARPAAKGRNSERERDQDDNSVETRSVGGRHFRKENGVWVDTAYSSARSTMVLSRGSEQFRSLVADEPGIKTIADQLDGEFIVVWKARAYRIR